MTRPSKRSANHKKREDAVTITTTGRRPAIVAIGSGLTGLTATKALKVAQLNITDALVFATRFAAQGFTHLASQAPQWNPALPAAVMVGILATLVVAAGADFVKLIAAPPISSRSASSVEAGTLWRPPIAKG